LQADHYMYPMLKKYGANFFPHIPEYHWLPYYGGDAAPQWENPKDTPQVGWADHVMAECQNAMTNCGIDLPVFGIFNVQGPKAFEFIDRICTKKPSRKEGVVRLAYTMNKDGILWNDVSLNTRGENDVYFIGLSGFGKYEFDQLDALRTELGYTKEDVSLTCQSYDQQLFHIFGPKAPKILGEILGQEVLDVPYFKFRKMTVKGIPIEAYSMSYAGLPGWELHCDKQYGPQLYDLLLSHPLSKAEGFKPCGVMGIQSFRTEMWFRGTPDVKGVTHYKGGLIEAATGKNHSCFGMDPAFEKQEQVVMLKVDTPKGLEWSLFGAQYPVFHNGKQVGRTVHSAYGARSQATHAFAVIDAKVEGAGNGNVYSVHAHDKEMPSVQMAEPMIQSSFRWK